MTQNDKILLKAKLNVIKSLNQSLHGMSGSATIPFSVTGMSPSGPVSVVIPPNQALMGVLKLQTDLTDKLMQLMEEVIEKS